MRKITVNTVIVSAPRKGFKMVAGERSIYCPHSPQKSFSKGGLSELC
jgi:hypothetical protein